MKTRVSVIIPVYNVQEFLNECVDSVLAQTLINKELTDGYERNLQIILVDDGSTDDSAIIAKEYADTFDNVDYVYEENQGLGHARNYGCEFAEGDYIIFLDSDDLVTPNAYERMYDAALRNNSDMTIGSVLRFNSKRYWTIKIHDTVFSQSKDVTHISETPELFYDTTAWNKLIKRTFWEKNAFKFPEGILYEDIPVTIPMHFLANNVSIIYEPCYLWRVREGISKSITQTTDDTKNLIDRLSVMRMVDTFYQENVTDPLQHQVKDIKWLKIDLMIFINKLKSMKKEDSKGIREILLDYINENIDLKMINHLNEFDQLKYKYLIDDDFDSLITLLNFEYEHLKYSEISSRDSKLVIDVDEEFFKESTFCVDKYVKDNKVLRYLQKVSLKKDKLFIKGFTIIPGLEDSDYSDRDYEFYLINSKTNKKLLLDFDNAKSGNLDSFKIPNGKKISYNCSGYKLHIPYSKIINNPDFFGENRIRIKFKQSGIEYSYFAGIAKKNVRKTSLGKGRIYEDYYLSLDYDYARQLIFNVIPIKYIYDNIFIEDDNLCISGPNEDIGMFLCYDGDSINKEYKIPLEYNHEKSFYYLDVEKISDVEGQIRYGDGVPIVYADKKQLILNSNKGQVIINALRDYHFDIKRRKETSVISDINSLNNDVNIRLKLYSTKDINHLKSAVLCLKEKNNFKIMAISEGTLIDDEINFKINFSDEKITKNLYQGTHDIYVQYTFEDEVIETPIFLLSLFKFNYSSDGYDYSVYRSGKSTLRIRSTRKVLSTEFSHMEVKNRILDNEYRWFRHLPINKNRIVFESMWGSKYSCNPRYLYEYIDKNHPEYECIWFLKDEHTPINGNGIRVRRNTLKYFYYLATSKYFVNNVNFSDYYSKRDGQIEIQTMHGTPLKTLGLDVATDFKTEKNKEDFLIKCGRWNFLTVQSDYTSNIAQRAFKFNKKVLNVGYPRTDILYTKNNENDILKLKEKLNIPLDKKVILYAPTWRLKNKFDLMLDLKSFKKSLSDEYILILRLHHFSVKGWSQPVNDDFVYDFSKYDSIEELFLVSDILITDYSSVMYDYAILDRPILLFTYDLEEYGEKLRGCYIDILENKPGPILFTSKEVEDAIINISETENKYKHYRDSFREKFNQYECGNSSELIYKEVFEKEGSNNIVNSLKSKLSNIAYSIIKHI